MHEYIWNNLLNCFIISCFNERRHVIASDIWRWEKTWCPERNEETNQKRMGAERSGYEQWPFPPTRASEVIIQSISEEVKPTRKEGTEKERTNMREEQTNDITRKSTMLCLLFDLHDVGSKGKSFKDGSKVEKKTTDVIIKSVRISERNRSYRVNGEMNRCFYRSERARSRDEKRERLRMSEREHQSQSSRCSSLLEVVRHSFYKNDHTSTKHKHAHSKHSRDYFYILCVLYTVTQSHTESHRTVRKRKQQRFNTRTLQRMRNLEENYTNPQSHLLRLSDIFRRNLNMMAVTIAAKPQFWAETMMPVFALSGVSSISLRDNDCMKCNEEGGTGTYRKESF